MNITIIHQQAIFTISYYIFRATRASKGNNWQTTPVLAFDCPWGPTEIITDGKDGLLVDNGNVSQLADSIIYLIDHPDVRKQRCKDNFETKSS